MDYIYSVQWKQRETTLIIYPLQSAVLFLVYVKFCYYLNWLSNRVFLRIGQQNNDPMSYPVWHDDISSLHVRGSWMAIVTTYEWKPLERTLNKSVLQMRTLHWVEEPKESLPLICRPCRYYHKMLKKKPDQCGDSSAEMAHIGIFKSKMYKPIS